MKNILVFTISKLDIFKNHDNLKIILAQKKLKY